ncbi:hypothetical protein WJX72_010645 [[Myrmecia] bisecta]|uniref:F-box domain-containing protein n=1 Tax=[Myrmecia] bisecta TaxID=41462 RepID=A0AAW1PZA3_9CHLO
MTQPCCSDSVFGQQIARAALVNVHTTQVELAEEDALLDLLRVLVGPHSSEQRLRQHLRTCCGKMHWAVNSYLRDALTASLESNSQPDFQAHLEAAPAAVAAEVATSQQADTDDASLPLLPAALVEEVLQRTNLSTVVAAAQSCHLLRKAAACDVVWRALYQQRWPGTSPQNAGDASADPDCKCVREFLSTNANTNVICSHLALRC